MTADYPVEPVEILRFKNSEHTLETPFVNYADFESIFYADFESISDAKVAGVRASNADASPPTFTAVDPGCSFTHFELLTVEDVAAAIRDLRTSSARAIQLRLVT